MNTIYTIGHSNLSLAEFLNLLKQHHIRAIADVRSHPYSRYLPHFSQKPLQEQLLQHQINYVFLGKQLGARPTNSDCYVNGKAVYSQIAKTTEFKQGIQELLTLAATNKTAIMCSEKDPINCHRAILICQHLKSYNLEIVHILSNGNLENHQDFESRLLEHTKLVKNSLQLSLFDHFQEELLQKAYQNQGEKIAYKEK
ncbi:MAG: DUF488 domain-containing protein [Gloeocapsa sp. DLM2.Bin57]|nr:MAG: DUF488 domain-containing protein [Gloeocapsa sp. DLM2.Bin57]